MRCMIQKCILNCIVINFKPTQNFDFQKTDMHFRFILFEKFPYEYIILTLWKDGTYCLSLFYLVIKMEVLSFSGKSYQTRQTAGKPLQKIEMLQQEHTKVSNITIYIFRWIYILLYPLPVLPMSLKREIKFQKYGV